MTKIQNHTANNLQRSERTVVKLQNHKNTPSQPISTKNSKKNKIAPTKSNGNISENIAVKNGIDSSIRKSQLESKLNAFVASRNNGSDKVKVTYIPFDQRHKGLSKYDNLPHFKNRPSGFPDRYRAVNPKLVESVRSEKDLSIKKEKAEKALLFPIKDGARIYDGRGEERGTITRERSSVKLNYAQVRIINNEKHYYAFSTRITDKNSGVKIDASGWIKASDIERGNDPKFTGEEIAKSQPPPVSESHGKHEKYEQYIVKNVKPEQLTDKNGKPKYGFFNEKKEFVSYKVLPGIDEKNVAASDYLMRTGNVINLGFNAAGLSNDTFKVDGTTPLVFIALRQLLKARP